jgi:hypothetical protein
LRAKNDLFLARAMEIGAPTGAVKASAMYIFYRA